MTVRELIAYLKTTPLDLEVEYDDGEYGKTKVKTVNVVRRNGKSVVVLNYGFCYAR
jgi:hypothetical protein